MTETSPRERVERALAKSQARYTGIRLEESVVTRLVFRGQSVIGMGQGNVLSGSFSNTVGLAYLVEKGEIVGRLRDVSIAGNVSEILRDRLGDLGRELEESTGSMRRPAVLVSSLSVVGK